MPDPTEAAAASSSGSSKGSRDSLHPPLRIAVCASSSSNSSFVKLEERVTKRRCAQERTRPENAVSRKGAEATVQAHGLEAEYSWRGRLEAESDAC